MSHYIGQHICLEEPKLLFNATKEYYSSNPIEGLLKWGPYDISIPGYFRPNPLRLAIISTEQGFSKLLEHLQRLNNPVKLREQHEYLRNYPCFRTIYQTELVFPQSKTDQFISLINSTDIRKCSLQKQPEIAFLNLLKQHLQSFISERHMFDVLIIHLPHEVSQFQRKVEAQYRFDLHDSLKAYSAPNGLKIQFIEDKSINYREPAQVCWWLSLALYVKANGIPWKLAKPSAKTAYVGLTFGIKPGKKGERIVLGCSQIFDERGEGLRFLLFQLENPVWYGREPFKNPFMTSQDARRLFLQVRETYQSINMYRPDRVVAYKTTYFSSDEIKGISEALEGVNEIELITIQQNTKYRAIMMEPSTQKISNFPVLRGTVLPLDGKNFLLWTQGDVLGIAPKRGWHYYQEKRGIPSPLVITRHRGKSSLEDVVIDILKLTKMNWNNLQLYSRLPVTLYFAHKISQIVKQMDSYSSIPYDFRYFI